jgi:tricorn protease
MRYDPRCIAVRTCALATVLFAQTVSAEPIRFARYPHVSNDGTIAFSYHGDIWLVNADGSNPRRLTAHIARDINPRFSPDGRTIAFSSNRMGNNDVYVVPVSGGEPRQLTWHSGDDVVLYWTPDGKGIVIATGRGANPWGAPLHVVPLEGGLPTPLGMDVGRSGMMKQDATMVAFNRTNMTYWRKGYRGNNSTDIDVLDLKSGEVKQITDTNLDNFRTFTQDAHPMWGADGMIYFLSERDGTFNIWRVAAGGGAPAQVTKHNRDGVQFPSISPDGKRIVYENEFELWTLEVPSGQPRKITVDLAFDPKHNQVQFLTSNNQADGFAPSPSGDFLAVDWHGEVFLVPTESETGEKTQITRSSWRDRLQQYAPDGKSLAYITDESGEEEIWLHDFAGGNKKKLTTHESFKQGFTWSPTSGKIAFAAANKLFEIDVVAGRSSEVANNPDGGFNGVSYSPDGKYVLYSRGDADLNTDIYALDVATKQEHNLTSNPFRDSGGQITPDGRWLVFSSNRDAGVNHLFVVSLRRLAQDPDDPTVRANARRGGRAGGGPDSTAAAAPTVIESEGISRRAIQITTGTNPVGSYFLARDGRTIYFTSTDNEGPGLFQIGIDGKDRRRVAAGNFNGLEVSADRRVIFYRQGGGGGGGRGGRGGGAGQGGGGDIMKLTLQNPTRPTRVAFNFRVTVDDRAEWEQLFEEAWRVMKYRFYDPDMHGKDWAAIKRTYKPLLKYAGSNEDVYDLANEMIGELNASHTGVSGPPSVDIADVNQTRHLGFELEPASGKYRISHIYQNGPADKEWLSLAKGDFVQAIDGQKLEAGFNYWKLLNETVNDYVPVQVSKSADGTGARTVRIKATTQGDINNLKYEEWIAKNRAFVEKESRGEVAYVHIRSMNQPSLEKFRNEIDQFWNRKGIVIDIRYNGGGNIDQELLDILERRPYEYWNSRWGSRAAGRRPRQAIAGPKVMLTNWRSASDSEVTPQGFRDLGLGRIVGNPTAAAVIATGSYNLINGGSIRTPGSKVMTYDPTKPNNYGINLENFGVAPDVMVKNTAMDELRGFDRELKAAVDEVMKMMKEGKWQFTTDGSQR